MIAEVDNLFKDHPDGDIALSFLKHYNVYCHAIDDIVDEKIDNAEVLLSTHMLALNLYSSIFYRKYQDILYPVIKLIHNTWLDSVEMERSSEMWAKEQADTLKNCGVEMMLTIVEILGGYNVRRKHSVAIRKLTYDKQHLIYEIV